MFRRWRRSRAALIALTAAAFLQMPELRAADPAVAQAGDMDTPNQERASLPDPNREPDLEPSPRLDRLIGLGLGYDIPVDGGGKYVPLVAVRAIADRYMGQGGKARFSYDSSSGYGVVEVPITSWLFAGATSTGNWLTTRSSTYRYTDGERRKDLEVNATSAGGGAVAGVRFGKFEIRAFADASSQWFHRAGLEPSDMVYPQEHCLGIFAIEASFSDLRHYRRYEFSDGFEGSLRAWYFVRNRWRQWGPPGLPQTDPSADREGAVVLGRLRASFRPMRTSEIRITCAAGAGIDVDVFTGIRAGSLIGEVQIPGYYYNELACDGLAVAGARWSMDLWKNAMGFASVTAGCVHLLSNQTLGVAGVSIGLTQKVFMGIPVTVEYAFSPTAKRKSGAGGHELYVLVAVGFF